MANLTNFSLHLVGDKTAYDPGEDVEGTLKVDVDGSLDVHENWIELEQTTYIAKGKSRRGFKRNFVADRLPEDCVHVLGGDGRGEDPFGNPVHKLAGSQLYYFCLKLSDASAYSFEDSIGYVRYYVKAFMRILGRPDVTAVAFISKLPKVDLNEMTDITEPSVHSATKMFRIGKIDAEVKSDRRAYVPGEDIIVSATVVNSSFTVVKSAYIGLSQTVTRVRAVRGELGSTVTILKKIEGPSCRSHGDASVKDEKITIPAVLPSQKCSSIHIEYAVIFVMILNGFNADFKLSTPIVVGTVPLISSINEALPAIPSTDDNDQSAIPDVPPNEASAVIHESPVAETSLNIGALLGDMEYVLDNMRLDLSARGFTSAASPEQNTSSFAVENIQGSSPTIGPPSGIQEHTATAGMNRIQVEALVLRDEVPPSASMEQDASSLSVEDGRAEPPAEQLSVRGASTSIPAPSTSMEQEALLFAVEISDPDVGSKDFLGDESLATNDND